MSSRKPKGATTKSYRVYPLFHNIYYACLTVVSRDHLSDYLINKYYKFQNVPKINVKQSGELLEHMVNDLYNIEITDSLISDIMHHPRMIHLNEYYRYKGIDVYTPRIALSVRLSDDTANKIKKLVKRLNTDTIGEVVETSIANHIIHASAGYYDLITFTIQNQSINK